jgi:hypothetical protein
MPRAKDSPKLLVAWQSFCTAALPGSPVIPKGTKLYADDPAYLAAPENFVEVDSGRKVFAAAAAEAAARNPKPVERGEQ